MLKPSISSISFHIPKNNYSTSFIQNNNKDRVNKIISKTGINKKFSSSENEYASDLAIVAAKKLIIKNNVNKKTIDMIIFCSQSPDYLIPGSSGKIQDKIFGKDNNVAAIDLSLGCSGFVYSLLLAKSLILGDDFKKVLILTADTYSKFIDKNNISVSSIFGDAASATLVEGLDIKDNEILKFDLGTDGSGIKDLFLPNSGSVKDLEKNNNLYMNGINLFSFTLKIVPQSIDNVLKKNNLLIDDIDYFIFHQANKYMLSALQEKLEISSEKFIIDTENYGNTTSSTIPITLYSKIKEGIIKEGDKILFCGFGVGLSWASTIIRVSKNLVDSINT